MQKLLGLSDKGMAMLAFNAQVTGQHMEAQSKSMVTGLELAEADLAQRGPGDYLGVRQSGIQSFKIASLFDRDLIALSRKEAILLLESDPQLLDGKNRFLREAINDYQRTSLAEMS